MGINDTRQWNIHWNSGSYIIIYVVMHGQHVHVRYNSFLSDKFVGKLIHWEKSTPKKISRYLLDDGKIQVHVKKKNIF